MLVLGLDFDELCQLAEVGELLALTDNLASRVHLVEHVPGQHADHLLVFQVVDDPLAVLVIVLGN